MSATPRPAGIRDAQKRMAQRETVERARCGDADAFMELIGPFDRDHRALAYGILGDRHRMDDALQEAYLKAYRGLSGFDGRAAIGTWLYRIVYNACLDELRREGRVVHLPLETVSELAGPAESAGAGISRDDLVHALRSLPAELRAVVVLVYTQGLDYGAVSEVVGIPVGTVASRLHRARRLLRRALDPEGGGA
jgi:RNA polymerase sigma-70 factor, ECF subfamily